MDYIFGNVHFLSRAPSEAYEYDSMASMLTSDQWDEVAIKDAWYRARITEFFVAAGYGSQIDAIRHAVHAAVSVDCEVFEVWRYMDNFGLTAPLGRSPMSARNEVVVRPHKTSLDPKEFRLLRDMLDKITAQDSIVTINAQGLAVAAPVPLRSIASDSTYYQVEKVVTPAPMLENLPPPELLAIDLDPSEQWLFSRSPELAPYSRFNISSEYGYYYLVGGGGRSPIDAVTYGTLQADGSVRPENNFEFFESTGVYTDWFEYEKADSPDNYPGGRFGLHPQEAPAVNENGLPYQFPFPSQADYVAVRKAEVLSLGGFADDHRYRLPIQKENQTKRTYTPDLAIAYSAPARDSTVTASCTSRHPRTNRLNPFDSRNFVRS